MNQTISVAFDQLANALNAIYDEGEAKSIANILFEDLLNISRTDRLVNPMKLLNHQEIELLSTSLDRLLDYEPVQHIVGFSYFCDSQFIVTTDTLIPRPETEELVYLVAQENTGQLCILDIGTGTGCIPISLNLKMKDAEIHAWDISDEVLAVAKRNALQLGARVHFEKMDALNPKTDKKFDIIISNPPYIPHSDRAQMSPNVLNYEPDLALFVENTDPLLFYRKIAEFGLTNLNPNGKLYFEIHERLGKEMQMLLMEKGYQQAQVIRDLNGKDRIVKALR